MANFDIASFNLLNWANSVADLYDSTPKDVEIVQKDNDGNLFTTTVANRGQIKEELWDDVGNALGQFNRTFYVDADNGDDNNTGDSSHPFKTLGKAVDSVPIGGRGNIHFISGTSDSRKSYTLTSINVGNFIHKSIILIVGDYNDIYLQPFADANASTADVQTVSLIDSSLFFKIPTTSILHLVDKSSNMNWSYLGRTHIINLEGNSNLLISAYNHSSDAPALIAEGTDNTPYFTGAITRDTYGYSANLSLYYLYSKFNNNTFIKLIHLYNTNAVISTYNIGTEDSSGNSVAFKDVIDGVVYDADSGNPVNVLSNINISN